MTQLSFAGSSTCISVNSGNWSDASTWNCGGDQVPIIDTQVSIKSGHTVMLDVDTPLIQLLTIDAGGDFAVAASANGLSLNISIFSGAPEIDLTEASIELFGDFTINADDLDIKLGSVKGPFGLTLNSTGETRLMGVIGTNNSINRLTSFMTDALGTTVFDIPNGGVNSANFIVNGPRTFNDNVLLFTTTHIKGTNGPITFNGTVDTEPSAGLRNFIFSRIYSSTLSFNQDVGVNRKLSEFQVFNSPGATLAINTSNFITHGKQAWTENVILNSPTGTVTLDNTNASTSHFIGIGASGKVVRSADGNPNSLVIQSSSGVRFNGDIGDDTFPIVTLTVSSVADIQLNSASLAATSLIEIEGDIVLSNDVSLTSNNLLFENIDNAGFDVTINNIGSLNTSLITGELSGSGDLIKIGAGELAISLQTSMTGNVFLNQGLLNNNSGVNDLFANAPVITIATGTVAKIGAGVSSNVDLSNGQILKGGGLCSCTLNVLGGIVAPGLTSGQVTNKLSMLSMEMNASSTLNIELNGASSGESYDQVIVEGANLTDAILNLSLGFTPAIGDTFTIIKVNGPAPATGAINGLLEGETIIINDRIFSISYSGGDGNDVELTVVGATRYYVDANAAALGDGLSWDTAFNTLQDALAVAISGKIWVAAGVYYPDEGNDNGRQSTFELSGVDIYGGFNGTETDKTQRDLALNVSVLSGDIDNNDNNDDGNFIAESTDDIQGSNVYHVLVIETDNIIIDGFVITAGEALDPVVKSQAQSTSTSKGINQNHIGAGISAFNHNIMINNVQFVGNIANVGGAAMASCNQCQIDGSDFYSNKVLSGGGGAISYSNNLAITNSEFIGNQAGGSGGAIIGSGVFDNVLFENNSSGYNGGAVSSIGNLEFISTKFINNSGFFGGAIRAFQSLTINNSLMRGNQSENNGGAIYATNLMSVTNSTLTGNKSSTGVGGAIYLSNVFSRTIDNSIIWNNQDSSGIGTLTASINVSNVQLTTTNSVFQGSGGSSNWDTSAGIDGGNNFDQDPLFVTDADPTTAPNDIGNARIKVGSPVIAQGDDTFVTELFDLDGNTRIVDTVEMGAYEFASYIVSVDVSGLSGSVVLQNNGGDDLMLATNATHTFSVEVARADSYDVSLLSQSTTVNQNCVLTNGSGVVADDAITNITLICTTIQYTVGGELFGLGVGSVFLNNNAGDEIELNANGVFQFPTALDDSSNYAVTVNTNPTNPNQTCAVTGGSSVSNDGTGQLAGADYSGIVVTCTTNQYDVNVEVTGLDGSNTLDFVNGASTHQSTADETFTLSTLDDLSPYDVIFTSNLTSPVQICTASANASGNLAGSDLTVVVTCTTNQYLIGGMASGLASNNSLTLSLDTENLVVNSNAAFVFLNAFNDATDYTVSIKTQPTTPNQVCVLSNSSGTIMGADIENITVSCTTNSYFIGGSVSGLLSGNSMQLQNNVSDDLTVSNNGAFVFNTPIIDEQNYAVTILNQPKNPNQPCTVSNGESNVAGDDVTTVDITCGAGDDLIFNNGFEL